MPERVTVVHHIGDYINVHDMRSLDLQRYDNVLILGREYLSDDEQTDAQTLVAYLIVRSRLRDMDPRPSVLVELMDADNVALFDDVPGEVVLSPSVMGRLLAHIALHPELAAVLDELFTVGGAELTYRDPADYGLEPGEMTFGALAVEAHAHRELLLGVRVSNADLDVRGDLCLAPEPDAVFPIGPTTRLAVITTIAVGPAQANRTE